MNSLYLFAGIGVYVITVIDLVKTTFSSTGGGNLTKGVSGFAWQLLFWLAGGNGRSRILPYAGTLAVLLVLGAWILGLWIGFFLLILSDPDSIMNSSTKAPADVYEKLYYAAFTLSTLGVGDFAATSDQWRVITGVAAFSGLIFITASITYFVPVLSAVGHQTKFCLYLHSMGKTPQELLINSWNGTDFSLFFDKATDLCQLLIQHSLNHHTYPVIHYFHNTSSKLSVGPSVVLLHESLQLLRNAVSEKVVSDRLALTMLQSALDQYLRVIRGDFMETDVQEHNLPKPNLESLRQSGIPLREGIMTDADLLKPFTNRRKLLDNLLASDGWTWDDVYKD